MSQTTYLVHLAVTKAGKFRITVPKLPGCRAVAPTFEQALDVAKKAIEKHLKALAKSGKAIPIEQRVSLPLCCQVIVEVPLLKRRGKTS